MASAEPSTGSPRGAAAAVGDSSPRGPRRQRPASAVTEAGHRAGTGDRGGAFALKAQKGRLGKNQPERPCGESPSNVLANTGQHPPDTQPNRARKLGQRHQAGPPHTEEGVTASASAGTSSLGWPFAAPWWLQSANSHPSHSPGFLPSRCQLGVHSRGCSCISSIMGTLKSAIQGHYISSRCSWPHAHHV